MTLATKLTLKGQAKDCAFKEDGAAPTGANLPQWCGDDNRKRSTEHAINTLFVLGITSSGSGSTESGCILGLLGSPNDIAMEGCNFATTEDGISPVIKAVNEQIIEEALMEEVWLSISNEATSIFLRWKQSLDATTGATLAKDECPKICVSFDTGWNQRGKGHNSPSGHSFLMCKFTKDAPQDVVKSKLCSFVQLGARSSATRLSTSQHHNIAV